MLAYSCFRASLVVQTIKNLPAVQGTWVQSLSREDPLEKRMATHSSILAWRIVWTGEPKGSKESDRTERLTLSLYFHISPSSTVACCILFSLKPPMVACGNQGGTSQVVLIVKNLPANARDKKDVGLIPGT